MKNGTKNSFMVAFIMILIGISLLVAGYIKGGLEDARQLVAEKNIISSKSISLSTAKFNSKQEVIKGDAIKQFTASDADNLVMTIGGSEVTIEDSEDENIYVNISNMGETQIYIEDRTLYITSTNKSIGPGTVIVSIPANKHFSATTLEIGASSFAVSNISCDSLNMDIGAGDASVKSLTVLSTADIDLGAGNLTVEAANIHDMDMDLGLGNLDFTGIVSGDIDADCGMGNATFSFQDSASSHSFDLSAEMGNITINGEDYGGFILHHNQDNDSDSQYDIECGMGNIEIKFAN